MNRALEELVWRRADSCCEYCRIPQEYDGFTHELDHVTAQKHHGLTIASNLVLACFPCNNHKGTNIAGIDPVTRQITKLFNPRRHKWARHFRWVGPILLGLTAIGRTTIDVLDINNSDRVLLRQALMDEGVYPLPSR